MENEKELNVEEQNKMVEEETPMVFVPDYSNDVQPVAPVKEETEETVITEYSTPVEPVQEIEPVQVEAQEDNVVPDYSNEVKPVAPVEPIDTELTEEQKAELREKYSKEEILENPNAKVTLNRPELKEEVKQVVEETVTKNDSLKFIIVLGIILLVIVFAIPYISRFFQL